MPITVTIVDAGTKRQITQAVVQDDNKVFYEKDDDILPGLFKTYGRKLNKKPLDLAKILNKDGWSNGYIMVLRDQDKEK